MQRAKIMLKKVNGISEYAQATHSTAPNLSKDYQKAIGSDAHTFNRGQGMLSKFANHAAGHKLIIPAFKIVWEKRREWKENCEQ